MDILPEVTAVVAASLVTDVGGGDGVWCDHVMLAEFQVRPDPARHGLYLLLSFLYQPF